MTDKIALICGVSGQDGSYLARHLVRSGYRVFGTTRDLSDQSFERLVQLDLLDEVQLLQLSLTDASSVFQVIDQVRPDEIYNLAGQSSVGISFSAPAETIESIVMATLNLLEGVRQSNPKIRFYNAVSGECFGECNTEGANEETPFAPRSPYGTAKASANWIVRNYRETYGLHAVSGILFNHESPLRDHRFVTHKIVNGALDIAAGRQEILELGALDVSRDWGWAPEYVVAMHQMLQSDTPEDFVVATGESNTLHEFVWHTFDNLGLCAKDHVIINDGFLRPNEIRFSKGDPKRASRLLNWRATTKMRDVVKLMIAAKRESMHNKTRV